MGLRQAKKVGTGQELDSWPVAPGRVLTCDQEVCEDQEAAAAEADGTVGRSQ